MVQWHCHQLAQAKTIWGSNPQLHQVINLSDSDATYKITNLTCLLAYVGKTLTINPYGNSNSELSRRVGNISTYFRQTIGSILKLNKIVKGNFKWPAKSAKKPQDEFLTDFGEITEGMLLYLKKLWYYPPNISIWSFEQPITTEKKLYDSFHCKMLNNPDTLTDTTVPLLYAIVFTFPTNKVHNFGKTVTLLF